MKIKNAIFALLAVSLCGACFGQWKPAGSQIKTKWAESVDVNNVLPEYPRPQMARKQWQNLNGLWDYAITAKNAAFEKSDGKILVPFPLESSLSGVGGALDNNHSLWYSRKFSIPQEWSGKNVMLNFGAVDWLCEAFVNGVKVGSHTGGYTPFSFDITAALNDGENTGVKLHWKRYLGTLPWRGKSQFIVDDVYIAKQPAERKPDASDGLQKMGNDL